MGERALKIRLRRGERRAAAFQPGAGERYIGARGVADLKPIRSRSELAFQKADAVLPDRDDLSRPDDIDIGDERIEQDGLTGRL